jgi:hypothetical protein
LFWLSTRISFLFNFIAYNNHSSHVSICIALFSIIFIVDLHQIMIDQQIGELCRLCQQEKIALKHENDGSSIMFCPTKNCWSRYIDANNNKEREKELLLKYKQKYERLIPTTATVEPVIGTAAAGRSSSMDTVQMRKESVSAESSSVDRADAEIVAKLSVVAEGIACDVKEEGSPAENDNVTMTVDEAEQELIETMATVAADQDTSVSIPFAKLTAEHLLHEDNDDDEDGEGEGSDDVGSRCRISSITTLPLIDSPLNPLKYVVEAVTAVSANAAAVGRGSILDVHRQICDLTIEQKAKLAEEQNVRHIL